MRSINSISGAQAIAIAAYAWWMSVRKAEVRRWVDEWLGTLQPDSLLDRTDMAVGTRFLGDDLGALRQLSDDLSADPAISFLLDFAVKNPGGSWLTDRGKATTYVGTLLAEDVGRHVKRTGWFDRNKAAIEAEKRRLKTVKRTLP